MRREKTHGWSWACRMVLLGQRVRRIRWAAGLSIGLQEQYRGTLCQFWDGDIGEPFKVMGSDMLGKDWVAA